MNIEELREYCLAKKGVTESFPFDETTLVFKVMGKMFTTTDIWQSKLKFEEVTTELKAKYNVVKYENRLFVVLTAEEYFKLAEEAQKKRRFEDAIYYYNKVVQHYPNNQDDYKASFMIAFLMQ